MICPMPPFKFAVAAGALEPTPQPEGGPATPPGDLAQHRHRLLTHQWQLAAKAFSR